MMSSLRNFIIKKLGGVTASERDKYEKWAVEHLTGINGEVTPNYHFYYPFAGDDICIIRSGIEICDRGVLVKEIIIAPWCRNVVIERISRIETDNNAK